ncbi:hypothetical protein ABW19_dt0200786 [Dactylella cylindrospora]|nr:hypothetical protein ABW19_dt0200786 [Dactylella cylindrospora]
MEQTLSTFELLEQILAEVPPLELLTTVRLVSKSWKAIVETSAILKWCTWTHTNSEVPPSLREQWDLKRKTTGSREPPYEFPDFALLAMRRFRSIVMNPRRPMELRTEESLKQEVEDFLERLPDIKLYRPRGPGVLYLNLMASGLLGNSLRDRGRPDNNENLPRMDVDNNLPLRHFLREIFKQSMSLETGMGISSVMWELENAPVEEWQRWEGAALEVFIYYSDELEPVAFQHQFFVLFAASEYHYIRSYLAWHRAYSPKVYKIARGWRRDSTDIFHYYIGADAESSDELL